MDPRRYLAVAAFAVVLSWAAVFGLVYNSVGVLRLQRQEFDYRTKQSLALQQMRGAILEIAAAGDELMMLGAFNRIEFLQPVDRLQSEFAGRLARSKENFSRGFDEFRNLLVERLRPLEHSANAAAAAAARSEVETIRIRYRDYVQASERLHRLAGSHVYLSYVIKVTGGQKSLETVLLSEIDRQLSNVKRELGHQYPDFEATIAEARISVLGLMALAIVPAFLTGFLTLRGIMTMFRQISSQKENIAKSNESLQEALVELKRVQTTLVESERLSTLGKLTATVSHELRNPMAAIRNALFIISEAAGSNDRVKINVERAERNITRCDNIIGDLLEYTRKRNFSMRAVGLSEWVKGVLDEQKLPVDIKLIGELHAPGVKVTLDDDRFRRVVINLVQNAVEAIGASKGFGEVSVFVGTVGGRAYIDVVDNGPGIADDVLPKIFEPLFTTKNFGAGLGLPTAKRLVEQHGGTLTVNSKPGVGTSFRVSLPLAVAEQERAA